MTYDAFTGEMSEKEENAPQKYVGLTREELQQELELYEKSPSLTDQEEGLSGVELLSFSGDRVVVRKNYEKAGRRILSCLMKTTMWLCTTEV